MQVKCHHCGHVWDYKGKSTLYALCSICRYKVSLKRQQGQGIRLDKDKGMFIVAENELKDSSGNTNYREKAFHTAGDARRFATLVENISLVTEWDEIADRVGKEEAANEPKRQEEMRKFAEIVMPALKKADEEAKRFKLMGNICIPPNAKELWCDACQWGFDIFLPAPSKVICCPFCAGIDIKDREHGWFPGKERTL